MGDVSDDPGAESDTSSLMGDASEMKPPSPASREALSKRLETLLGENSRLRIELEGQRFRVKTLQQENKSLKHASVLIQAKAEQEEEFISNTLLKKIQELKKEKESLALNYEQEEEFLTNDLSRKLFQLRNEKAELAQTLQQEQESLVNKLMRKIQKLESDTNAKQANLEQLRREKVELENTLEQEQEALVNRLWKRMDRLEAEKRSLQERMDPSSISAPPSPMDVSSNIATAQILPSRTTPPGRLSAESSTMPQGMGGGRHTGGMLNSSSDSVQLVRHIQQLRDEVLKLKLQLASSENQHVEKTAHLAREEQHMREENLRLRRKLELEVERRQELCRHLSESESSLEMEDERHFNEMSVVGAIPAPPASAAAANSTIPSSGGVLGGGVVNCGGTGTVGLPRGRTISSPNPVAFVPGASRSISPALGALSVALPPNTIGPPSQLSPVSACGSMLRCPQCGWPLTSLVSTPSGIGTMWQTTAISSSTPIVAAMAMCTSASMNNSSSSSSSTTGQRTKSISGTSSNRQTTEQFARPAPPTTPKAASPAPASPRPVGEPMDFSSSSSRR